MSQKMTEINYVRNLSGVSPANRCWPCEPAAACAAAGSCGSSGAFCFIPVVPGVLLCWLTRSLPRVRYKILLARLLGGENGTKLSLHAEQARNWAISGEQGEFCTGHRELTPPTPIASQSPTPPEGHGVTLTWLTIRIGYDDPDRF